MDYPKKLSGMMLSTFRTMQEETLTTLRKNPFKASMRGSDGCAGCRVYDRKFNSWTYRNEPAPELQCAGGHVEFEIVALDHNLLEVAGVRLATFLQKRQQKNSTEKHRVFPCHFHFRDLLDSPCHFTLSLYLPV